MADRSLRGMRLGAQSLQSEEGVELEARAKHSYRCPHCGHVTELHFAVGAEPPATWTCRQCSSEAKLVGADNTVQEDDPAAENTARTPWDMLLERRSREELEALLEERLAYLRTRRGKQSLDA